MNLNLIPIIIPSLEPDDRLITTIEKLYTEQLGPIVVVDEYQANNSPARKSIAT